MQATAFAQAAVEAICDGGEVDFLEEIIYDSSLDNYPCHKQVISEAIGTCSPITQAIMSVFEASDYMNLTFKVSNAITSNASTTQVSSYDPINHICNITITFRESYLQTATDLSIARTAIHESIHALLVYMFEENLLLDSNNEPMTGFEDFVEAYINYLGGLPSNLGVAHHELMSDFVGEMASSLQYYAAQTGNPQSYEFCKKLCWSGDIIRTPTFQSLYPEYLNPSDAINNPANVNPNYLDIINTNAAEQNNSTYSYSHPNGITYQHIPVGTPPNSSEPCN